MRMRTLQVILVATSTATGLSSLPATVLAQVPPIAPEKASLIRRVLKLTNATELAIQTLQTAISAQRAASPQVPEEFWNELAVRVRREAPHYLDMLLPIYDAQFTTAQLTELVAFYESPLGRHLVEIQPAIVMQSAEAGQRWGTALAAEITHDLTSRGTRLSHP